MKELSDLVAFKIQEGIVGSFAGHDFTRDELEEKDGVLRQEASGLYIRGPEHILVRRGAGTASTSQPIANAFGAEKFTTSCYALRFRGTRLPFFRAFERPIAIACLRLFTLPPRPLLAVPRL
jgi:hypothetical protein